MIELPEATTIARDLEKTILGKKLKKLLSIEKITSLPFSMMTLKKISKEY